MEKLEKTDLSIVTATLDLKIQDFVTTTTEVCGYHSKQYQNFPVYFYASVFPTGIDEDWLSVRARVIVYSFGSLIEMFGLKWAVSIIDTQGRTSFTRYFENPCSGTFLCIPTKDFSPENGPTPQVFDILSAHSQADETAEATCLEKSFILNRAEELISDGVLFLRCDISVDIDVIKPLLFPDDRLDNFIRSIPQAVCYKNGDETEISNNTYTVFDFSEQILTLPQFHDLRKRYGVYGLSPVSTSNSSESKEDITDMLEHIWIFDTRSDRFLLSLAPNPDNVGHLLVNASPVIRRCVRAPMKEQRDKRIVFPDVNSRAFQIVLHFLKSGEADDFFFDNVVEVYKFSHLYEMHNLQLKCAPIIAYCETQTQHEEIEKIAELYEDTYLLKLLQLHKLRHLEDGYTFAKDDRLDFDFYN